MPLVSSDVCGIRHVDPELTWAKRIVSRLSTRNRVDRNFNFFVGSYLIVSCRKQGLHRGQDKVPKFPKALGLECHISQQLYGGTEVIQSN